MFICNFKLNKKALWKLLIIVLTILVVVLMCFAIFRIFFSNQNVESEDVLQISSSDYTNFLKASHENMEEYLGTKICVTGYVYRLPDFSSTQFVLARTMILDNSSSAVVVGILCECSSAEKYDTGAWVEITGVIQRGNYNGELPVVAVSDIKSVSSPSDEFVYMPTD